MNQSGPVSRRSWLALGASGAIAVAAWTIPSRWPVSTVTSDPELTALLAEREQLRGNEDAVLNHWRQRSEALHQQSWTADNLHALKREAELYGWWNWTTVDTQPHRVTLTQTDCSLNVWPDCVALLVMLETKTGVIVESFKARAAGNRTWRRFDEIRLQLRFPRSDAATNDEERTVSGPPPVVPADGSAKSPKISDASLRSAAPPPPPSLRQRVRHPLRSGPTLWVPGPNEPNNQNIAMITLNIQLPEPVAAEFYAAADELNRRFTGANPKIEAKSLMAFALARHECAEICAQFDLALRLVQGPDEPPFNPVLTQTFGRDDRPVLPQPASQQEAA